nr:MAG: hypothetical protein DIU81_08355 [[Clostridium] cellulosi]
MPQINNYMVLPSVIQLLNKDPAIFGTNGGLYSISEYGISGGFGGIILLTGVIVAAFIVIFVNAKANKPRIIPPYACGALSDEKGRDFIGPKDKVEKVMLHNYYLSGIFGEKKLMPVVSVISAIIILIMFGVS